MCADIIICGYYHAEDDTCGLSGIGEDFDKCNYVECVYGCYELEPEAHGNINWPVAFGFDDGFRCETFDMK